MKRISIVASKRTRDHGAGSASQKTEAHCPVSGHWQDPQGRIRYISEGAVFPAASGDPSTWTLTDLSPGTD
jgi:hypothetical protein